MSYILLVDDDRDDIQLTMLGFRDAGFKCDVAVAHDGKEALDFLLGAYSAHRSLPAAVLLDLKMPRMDGFEFIMRIKNDPRLRHIPVAVLTSSGHEADIQEAGRLGASRYLRKPTDLKDYLGIVVQVKALMAGKTAPLGPGAP